MVTAIVLIKADVARIPETAEAIAQIPQVSEVYSVTGEFDLVAMVRVRGHEELGDVIPGTLNKVPGVTHTETHIAFRTYSRHDLEAAFAHRLPRVSLRSGRDARGIPLTGRTACLVRQCRQVSGVSAALGARRLLASAQRSSSAAAAPESTAPAAAGSRPAARPTAASGSGAPASATSAAAAFSSTVSRTGPRSPPSTARTTAALCAGSPPRRSSGLDRGMPSSAGSNLACADRAVVHDPDRRRAGRGQLVEAVVAVEHQRRAAAAGQHAGQDRAHPRVRDADRLAAWAAPGSRPGRGS